MADKQEELAGRRKAAQEKLAQEADRLKEEAEEERRAREQLEESYQASNEGLKAEVEEAQRKLQEAYAQLQEALESNARLRSDLDDAHTRLRATSESDAAKDRRIRELEDELAKHRPRPSHQPQFGAFHQSSVSHQQSHPSPPQGYPNAPTFWADVHRAAAASNALPLYQPHPVQQPPYLQPTAPSSQAPSQSQHYLNGPSAVTPMAGGSVP